MGCVTSKQTGARAAAPREPAAAWDGRIHAPRAWKVEPALTAAQLARLRSEFWETRVEGRPEMWHALRFAAEAESPALAEQTIAAAGLRPANRRATLQSAFDERGALYEVPMYALSDPTNLDVAPTCAEFKDAARAVDDYIKARDRSRRPMRVH